MKQIKVIFWLTLILGILGLLFGAFYGVALSTVILSLDPSFRDTLDLELGTGGVLGALLGTVLGGFAGAALGAITGFFAALALFQYDLPLDAGQARRTWLTGLFGAGLASAGGVVFMFWQGWSLVELAAFLLVPLLIALPVTAWVARRYSRRLMTVTDKADARQFGCVSNLVLLLTGGYALLVIAGWVSGLVAPDFVPAAIYSSFAHWLWLGAFVAVLPALLWRRWSAVLLLLVPMALFTLVFGGRMLRSLNTSDVAVGNDPEITVMSYNLLWRARGLDDRIALIRASDADIVALQELGMDEAAAIDAELRDVYPFMALHPQSWGIDGQGLLSRYPIVESEFWEGAGVFGAQEAVIAFSEGSRTQTLTIHNVHPHHPLIGNDFYNVQSLRAGVTNILARAEADADGYSILLGDFNMPELGLDAAIIREDWNDAYRQRGAGLGQTFLYRSRRLPITLPIFRLDYIFVERAGNIDVRAAWVSADSGGSDHLPVFARLAIDLDPTASDF